MDELKIARETGATGSTTILRLLGPLTISNLFALQDELRTIGSVDTVIDVSDTPYIDSAGLGSILSRWAHAQRSGNKFALTGVSPRIRVLLELTRVDSVLPMYPTAADADRAFGGKAAQA